MTDTKEQEIIHEYTALINKYINGEMSASDFSLQYIEKFKNDDDPISDDTYWILQHLFAEADAYCEPEIREDVRDAIGEEELTEAAREASVQLEQRLAKLDN